MTKLRTLIVDDEPLALQLLKSKLAKIDELEIIGECSNGRQAIESIMSLTPDLVFLDIQMPGIDGFGVIEQLQNDVVPLIIFTTAFEKYAIDAFDVHAVDYILKPLDDERLQRAVQRAQAQHAQLEESNSKQRIIGAINTMMNADETAAGTEVDSAETETTARANNKILIKEKGEIFLIEQKDIAWIDAAGDYACIHVDGITYIKRSTLKQLLDELDPTIFKRVHRSTIVNLNFITKVTPRTKGEFILQFGEHEHVKVSRNYKDAIKNFLNRK